MSNADFLRSGLRDMGKFIIVDKGDLPLVSWALADDSAYTVFDLQDKLRNRGWIVPAYNCPTGATDLAIMRVVVKENFGRSLADMLLEDIQKAVLWLEAHPTKHATLKEEIVKSGLKRRESVTQGDVNAALVEKGRLEKMFSKHDVLHVNHDPAHRISGDKTQAVC
jgi:glutamate/tyrosine decarboxylase-like PLP-dependent enzyme